MISRERCEKACERINGMREGKEDEEQGFRMEKITEKATSAYVSSSMNLDKLVKKLFCLQDFRFSNSI